MISPKIRSFAKLIALLGNDRKEDETSFSGTKMQEDESSLHSNGDLSYMSIYICQKHTAKGNSLAVQWLGLHTLTAEGPGSIPGWGTRIPHPTSCASWSPKKLRYVI